jgi:2,3-bisphosphoglycerate-independent phosphoglycerate mutase
MTENSAVKTPRPVVLCILDGWGDGAPSDTNAISLTDTPVWDRLVATSPRAQLRASEGDVGLPDGQMGNSEVGHTNIGAGRVVMQDLPRINDAVASGALAKQSALLNLITKLQESGGTCHLLGLMSPGGVHSHQDHMAELAKIVSAAGVPVAVHAFLDGRDTPPSSGSGYVERFLDDIAETDNASIATVCGRFYALDRDNRWERVSKACAAIMEGDAEHNDHPVDAINQSYEAGTTDEFIEPVVIGGYDGMRDGDGLLMANFRADRAREILSVLVDPDFDGYERPRQIDFATRLGMVEYSTDLNRFIESIFPPVELSNILGEVVSNAGLRQLRIAETEKYAHVTFFFNGGREEEYAGEDRILVPSPKVATYDLQPEMSAPEVTDNLVRVIGEETYDLIIVNFANGDMVGHTGILSAACKAVQTLDQCLDRLEQAVNNAGGVLMITADHGNCESMDDGKGGPHTAHTLNMVPVVLANAPGDVRGLHDGSLADIAPTLLELLGLDQPQDMSGRSLVDR